MSVLVLCCGFISVLLITPAAVDVQCQSRWGGRQRVPSRSSLDASALGKLALSLSCCKLGDKLGSAPAYRETEQQTP
jgi:hypothetical protein